MFSDIISNFTINLKKAGCRHKGLHAEFLKLWYLGVIEKPFSYDCEVWATDLKISSLKDLSSHQWLALLSVTKASNLVSTDALCMITGIPPIHLALKYRADRFFGRDRCDRAR